MTAATVVLASGHMTDGPDRPSPRFPESEVPRVAAEIRAAFERWQVGPDTTVVCGGARGADLIAAEAGLALGARVLVCLALPVEEFERRSVHVEGRDWAERFHRVLDVAEVQVNEHPTAGDAVFDEANAWMVAVAQNLAPDDRPHVALVWNGQGGDGRGGTSDMIRRLQIGAPDERVLVVDPTPRAYAARQAAGRPKRLLSLDGGGIRGALSLAVLGALEARLRERYGRSDLVLADYFDHIAGTSTGAIIAAGLAMGLPAGELAGHYDKLGAVVFRKRMLHRRLRSLYGSSALREQLRAILGGGTTLGDPRMRTLLLVVMHNVQTDSHWLLSNATNGKYNRAERNLLPLPDRNLDIALASLVRASTAAPVYFAPEELQLGQRKFLFQDGGMTPFNNPAVAQLLVATLPEYGLAWPTGEDRLLVVSVGTGSSSAVHPALRRGRAGTLFGLANLPSVLMNGAAVSQDLLCRCLGSCRFGPAIDREVGDRIGAPNLGGSSLFTYVRYDADLSDDTLRDTFHITDHKVRARVRKLDAVEHLPLLKDLGRAVGATIDLDTHFAGFLD